MTIQTHPVGATTHHTEQTLRARYQEALDVYEAWSDRVRSSGGQDRVAAELQRDDAWSWVETTRVELEAFRAAHRERAAAPGWTRPHGRSGVVGRPNRC
ncbi:hypothetical protein [Arthrobacter sp. B3I4]|uniref:hypothetical protein n=1 Tax=Arthrobacter sp. B3I4 TaxID=3042267 RepID=UPI0027882617|nr:hypothetical protein [Arthrobacter sp. B3I4]MDQ0756103.1 hypothetical protein [Arthrobacter sp. B3I4]